VLGDGALADNAPGTLALARSTSAWTSAARGASTADLLRLKDLQSKSFTDLRLRHHQ
jgi:hypothetical protein